MNLEEFLDKVDLDSLHKRLTSEMNVDAELHVDTDFDNEFLLEVKIFNHLVGMKIAERIDFEIFVRDSRFDYMTVAFPRNCLKSRVDRLISIAKIAEDHIESALNS